MSHRNNEVNYDDYNENKKYYNSYEKNENSNIHSSKKDKSYNLNLDKDQNLYFNISNFQNVWDFSNIPEHILKLDNFDEILSELSSRKYKTCKASVIYHPFKKEFYFRNPLGKTNTFKDYIKLKCRDFLSREISLRQRFLINKKDVEEILENNQGSILNIGKQELTDIGNGLELTLFPVKFYKNIQENNYTYSKYLLCYDSIKLLGINFNSDNYYIISTMDKHRILSCDSKFKNKNDFTMNNFIKYTSYCDEFCNEDYVFFSSDLIKCKCEFYYANSNINVNDINMNNKNKEDYFYYGNSNRECFYRRKFDAFEKFSHPYEINEQLQKIDHVNKPYLRFYFDILTLIFSIQLLYMYYYITVNRIFIRFCIFSFIISCLIGYIFIRIDFRYKELLNFQILFELVHDIYPLLLILFFNFKYTNKKYYSNGNFIDNRILSLTGNNPKFTNFFSIFNKIRTIESNNTNNLANETYQLNDSIINNISNNDSNNNTSLNASLSDDNILNNYLRKVILEYERILFDKSNIKICLLIFIDNLDNILREIRVNEIEIFLRIITLIFTFFLRCENLIINLYCFNVRFKLLMEFLSRLILFLVENLILINMTIPLYIILGRPREYFYYNDQLLFQLNYLTLKPNSEKFSDNWFLEALNFHKIKNLILLLKFWRYVFLICILTVTLVPKVFFSFLNNLFELKFSKMFFSYVKIVYNMNISYLYYEPSKKFYYFFAFPFFLIFLFHDIFLTKDTVKIFIFHFLLGLVLTLLEGKEKTIRNIIFKRSRTTTSLNIINNTNLNNRYNNNSSNNGGIRRNNLLRNIISDENIVGFNSDGADNIDRININGR